MMESPKFNLYVRRTVDCRDGSEQYTGRLKGWPYYKFGTGETLEKLFLCLRVDYNASCSGLNATNTVVHDVESFYDENDMFSPPYEVVKE